MGTNPLVQQLPISQGRKIIVSEKAAASKLTFMKYESQKNQVLAYDGLVDYGFPTSNETFLEMGTLYSSELINDNSIGIYIIELSVTDVVKVH